MFFQVLLFCLIAYGNGRPSDSDERDEILREAKKEKHFQHDSIDEIPQHQTESSTAAENILNRLKSIAHLRMSEMKKPALDSVTREELEALRDLLDKNLQKYQNYNEFTTRKRPSDPYIGQILQNLNGESQSTGGGNNNMQEHYHYNHNNNNNEGDMAEQLSPERHQLPIRRKIIRHTVFATPMQGSNAGAPNRIYNGGDARIDWTSPWADYFPILIKDPLQTMMNSFSEIIEYGPAADICRHATNNGDAATAVTGEDVNRLDGKGSSSRTDRRTSDGGTVSTVVRETRRRSRRNAAVRSEEEKGALLNHVRPFKSTTTTTADPTKMFPWSPDKQATEHNGDTGPQIKRLVVRRGGVAIAGPGGIATAGSGGTAIVGAGGSAYSTKHTAAGASADAPMPPAGGISMAGYGPQVVNTPTGYYAPYPPQANGFARSVDAGAGGTAVLSTDGVAYTFPAPSRGLTAARRTRGGDGLREISLPDGAKLIATGPIVYYNPEPSVRKRSRKGKKSATRGTASAGKHDDRKF
ncbi:uncharacterized protein LOC112597870 isoform X2 [Melanaphis sacchari]|uniref:uncharacterized protein LOC112597870 isoform X2 n=1 Tax=Melanaphis sacchari TaxID=742174 RepID=UPI000DC14C78|nr:uncharacterized protein LOC112597870 isoform X2 [Melanaphis sacchari]